MPSHTLNNFHSAGVSSCGAVAGWQSTTPPPPPPHRLGGGLPAVSRRPDPSTSSAPRRRTPSCPSGTASPSPWSGPAPGPRPTSPCCPTAPRPPPLARWRVVGPAWHRRGCRGACGRGWSRWCISGRGWPCGPLRQPRGSLALLWIGRAVVSLPGQVPWEAESSGNWVC